MILRLSPIKLARFELDDQFSHFQQEKRKAFQNQSMKMITLLDGRILDDVGDQNRPPAAAPVSPRIQTQRPRQQQPRIEAPPGAETDQFRLRFVVQRLHCSAARELRHRHCSLSLSESRAHGVHSLPSF